MTYGIVKNIPNKRGDIAEMITYNSIPKDIWQHVSVIIFTRFLLIDNLFDNSLYQFKSITYILDSKIQLFLILEQAGRMRLNEAR